MRIAVIFGTRPEAIKMAPVVRDLRSNSRAKAAFQTLVFVTAQHREMLDQVLAHFEIEPDADLDIMRPGQDLAGLTARLIESLYGLLSETVPDLVLVHGDTTAALAASLAAYYRKIPVGHVEAGLRTRNRYSPFPEEMTHGQAAPGHGMDPQVFKHDQIEALDLLSDEPVEKILARVGDSHQEALQQPHGLAAIRSPELLPGDRPLDNPQLPQMSRAPLPVGRAGSGWDTRGKRTP